MNDRLDSLLTQLRAQGPDRELGAIEHDVRRRLAHEQAATAGLRPARAVAVGLALVLGTGVGGMTAATAVVAPRTSIFAATEALAPSSLLEGHR